MKQHPAPIRVEVTADDIARGHRRNSLFSPIARALFRLGHGKCFEYVRHFNAPDGKGNFSIPPDVIELIYRYDIEGAEFPPICFVAEPVKGPLP